MADLVSQPPVYLLVVCWVTGWGQWGQSATTVLPAWPTGMSWRFVVNDVIYHTVENTSLPLLGASTHAILDHLIATCIVCQVRGIMQWPHHRITYYCPNLGMSTPENNSIFTTHKKQLKAAETTY